jgi:predicted small secreted protein
MKTLKNLYGLLFVITLLSISACNTMEGAGEDIQRGGQHIEDAAKKNR